MKQLREGRLDRREAPPHWQLMLLWTVALASSWTIGPFLAAGTWRWPACWAYLVVLAAGTALHRRYVSRQNPELVQRRRRIGEGTRPWDVVWTLLFWPQLIAAPLVAGFGVRFGWTLLPWYFFPPGAVLFGAGLALSARAMAVNPHFEGTVRLQRELGHRVIAVGPYAVIRHPGYLGLIAWGVSGPLLLCSVAALVPAALVVGWIVLRTALEDAFLRRELAGYAEYTAQVRWRLVPGLW